MSTTIDIKSPSGQTLLSTPINRGAKGYYSLMQHDYITLPFSLKTPIDFGLGSYVDLRGVFDEALGGKLAKIYYVKSLPTPAYNDATGGYDYTLRLDAYYWLWANFIFKYTPENAGQEAVWSLTAPLSVHLGVYLRNLSALGFTYGDSNAAFTYSIDTTVSTEAIALTYSNTNLIDALNMMAEALDCEWWVRENVIFFGKCEQGDAVELEIGVSAETMTRNESKGTYATRIYAFGSTRNIPTNYRPVTEQTVVNGVVQKRLMLPEGTPYIDAYPNMTRDQVVESVVVFENVYPRRTGTLSDVQTVDRAIEGEDGEQTGTFKAYQYKDSGITFDKSYILPDQELRIVFQSGKLNGLDFAVTFNPNNANPAEQLWEIVANEDYGRLLPDETLKPENGDTYILYNFDIELVSDQYIPAAEEELKEEAEKYVAKTKVDDGTYTVPLYADWVKEDEINRTFDFGQKISLKNPALFGTENRLSRVIGWEMNLDKPHDRPVYTIGESAQYSRIGELEDKVEAITYGGQTYTGGGGSGVYLIKTNDSTPASNSNAYSALRAIKEFLSKTKPDSTSYLLKLLAGAEFGQFATGATGARITKEGNAELLDLVLRGVQTIGKYVSGVSGGRITASGWSELEALLLREGIRTVDFATGALGSGFCLKKDENGDTYLEVDRMLVRKTATFIQLTIQEVKHVGGQIVLTSASMKCTRVQEFTQYYRCYFEDTDGERTIENLFVAGDQARCQTFNIKPGVHENVSNQYYWRLVLAVGDDYIDLSKSDCDAGSTAPLKGDEIVQLGHRTDAARQCAIILSAFGDDAPYFKMYRGINSYQLSGKEFVNVSRSAVKIIADTLEFSTGETVKQYIDTQVGNSKTEIKEEVQEAVLGVVDDKIIGAVRTEVTTVVSEMEFGGRNYVLKSEGPQTANKTYNLSIPLSEFAGESIALSFDYEYSNVSTGSDMRSYRFGLETTVTNASGTTQYITVSHDLPASSTGLSGKGRFSTVRTVPASAQSGGSTVSAFIQVLSGDVTISHIKIEKGTVSTDWTPAPEDLETIAEQAQLVAGQAVNAANDAAQAAADAAQEALEAQNRLDSWAADGVISPTEKQTLKDEIARIDADKEEITDGYTRYGLGTPTAFNTAYTAYRSQLVTLSAATPEVIAIPDDFAAKQEAYYTARTAALNAIAAAAKIYIDQKETSITQSVTDSIWQVLPEEIKGQVTTEVNTIIGGADIAYRNLVKEGDYGIEGSSNYFIKEVELYTELVEGEEYTMVLSGSLGSGKQFGIWDDVAIHNQGFLTNLAGRIYALTFTYERDTSSTRSDLLRLYNWPQSTTAPCDVDWVCLYKGEPVAIPEYFIPAWEDEDAKIIAVREWMSGQLSVTDEKIQATVEKITTVDNKLSGYVTTEAYTTDIQQLSDRITSTVTSINSVEDKLSGYVTLTQYSTKIQQLDTSISMKASQSSVDSLTGRVSEAEAEISIMPDKISLEVKNGIDGMSIGGRNYVLQSAGPFTASTSTVRFSVPLSDFKGKKIIVSFDYEYENVTTGSTVRQCRFGVEPTVKNTSGSTVYYTTVYSLPANSSGLSGKGRYSHEWTVTDSAQDGSGTNMFVFTQIVSGTVKISNIKIEEGNKSTGWTPAPEDITTDLLNTGIDIEQKQITITADKLLIRGATGGTPIAVFKNVGGNPVLQAPYIDVDNLTVKHLEGADGSIGAFNIDRGLFNISDNPQAYIRIEKNGGRFFQVNYGSSEMCKIRGDGATALDLSAYGNNSKALYAVAQAGYQSYAIMTYGDVQMNTRADETVFIQGLRVNVRNVTASGTVGTNDDFLHFKNTSDITMMMPSPLTYKGKVYYFKRTGANVTFSGAKFMNSNGWQTATTYSITDTVAIMMVADGDCWQIFYCG